MAKYGVDLDRLSSAVVNARQAMRWNREQFQFSARQGAGSRWSEQTAKERIHVNLISLYQKIVLRNLIDHSPRFLLSTFNPQFKPAVSVFQEGLHTELECMHFAETARTCIQSGLHGVGICKVAIADPADVAMRAWTYKAGNPFASPIDFDDWVWDTNARHPSECSFMGHRFRVPLAAIKDSKRYDKSRKDLSASTNPKFNESGDERIGVLGRGYYGADEELTDMVDLWEIYCPRERVVITMAADSITGISATSHGGKPTALLEQDWIGPDSGPYEILGYERVPGNLMPKGPIQDLMDLHLPLNAMMRKLINQAQRMKQLTFFRKGLDGDMARVIDSSDGDAVPIDDVESIVDHICGGPNQMLFQFFLQMKEVYSWFAGNLDVMGGLSPQGRTATQEKLLNQNSSGGIVEMKSATNEFLRRVVEKIAWWHWHHPTNTMKGTYAPKGLPDMQIERQLKPWTQAAPGVMARTGDWDQIDLRIDETSMTNVPAEQKAQDLIEVLTKAWGPFQQQAGQQGVFLNFKTLFKKLGEYRGDPDMTDILDEREPAPPPESQGAGAPPGQPSPETTTHVRENMPGRTTKGDMMNRMNAMQGINIGGNPNQPQ